MSVFAYPGAGATADKVEASGHVTTAQPPEGLKMAVSHLGTQSVLADGAPVKTLGAQAQRSFLAGSIVTYCPPGLLALSAVS